MDALKVQWVRSSISCTKDQRATVRSLGFRRLYQVKTLKNSPEIRGMVKKVIHLLKIVEGAE